MTAASERPRATLAVVTFVVLVLELTSTRLFAYVGSTHATSTALAIAMLGLGVGAALGLRFPWWARPDRATVTLALALLVLAGATTAGASLPPIVALSLVPFALAGILMSGAYATRGSAAARATYALDLAAAAGGCLVAPRLVGPLSPVQIMAALGVLVCVLALWLVGGRRARGGVALLASVHVALLVVPLPDGPLAVLLDPDVPSEKAIRELEVTTAAVVDSVWSPLGRLDTVRVSDERLGIFTDGMSPTYLVQEAHARAGRIEEAWGLLMALPYRALAPARVLVLGAGAGASVWIARKYGAAQVDAVEVNPAIRRVLARWTRFGGDVYHQPGVRLFTDDARRFLIDTPARYDLIELALALTGNSHAQPAGMEAHLYTVEAVELYLSRLTERGSLVLIHSDAGNAFRQLRTVLAALARAGVARPAALDHVVVLHDPRPATAYRYLIVVRRSPIPLEVVDLLDAEPAELLWGPGDPPERAVELLDGARLGATAADDLSHVHDERPYFFQNTRGLRATALAEPGRLWVLAGALLLVAILLAARGDGSLRAGATASCLGAAFLCVELALIQRFTLAAGGTLYAVSFVLFGLLAWSAVGALVLGTWWRRIARGVSWACVSAAVAITFTAWLLRDLAWLDAITSATGRRLAILALLAPAGLAIGCPFPLLLAAQRARSRDIARLWAINGAASVVGGIVGVLALRVGGSSDTLVLAAAGYLAAAALAARIRADRA